mgnify:CR=1 FL=1
MLSTNALGGLTADVISAISSFREGQRRVTGWETAIRAEDCPDTSWEHMPSSRHCRRKSAYEDWNSPGNRPRRAMASAPETDATGRWSRGADAPESRGPPRT